MHRWAQKGVDFSLDSHSGVGIAYLWTWHTKSRRYSYLSCVLTVWLFYFSNWLLVVGRYTYSTSSDSCDCHHCSIIYKLSPEWLVSSVARQVYPVATKKRTSCQGQYHNTQREIKIVNLLKLTTHVQPVTLQLCDNALLRVVSDCRPALRQGLHKQIDPVWIFRVHSGNKNKWPGRKVIFLLIDWLYICSFLQTHNYIGPLFCGPLGKGSRNMDLCI